MNKKPILLSVLVAHKNQINPTSIYPVSLLTFDFKKVIVSRYAVIFFTLFISTITNAQKYKDSKYTIASYGSMNQNGALLSDITFVTSTTNVYRWDDAAGAAKTDKLWKIQGNVGIESSFLNSSGYVYKNVLYPYGEFSGDYPKIVRFSSINIRVTFVNGLVKEGNVGYAYGLSYDGHNGEKSSPHEREGYQISSVQILNARHNATERTIQNFLDQQANSNQSKPNKEDNTQPSTTNSSNTNSTTSSNSTQSPTTGLSNTNMTNSSNNTTDSNKINAETTAALAKEKEEAATKAELVRVADQIRLREQMVTDVAATTTKFAEGFSEGVFTDLRIAVNFRLSEGVTNQHGDKDFTFIDMVTYDLGIGVGRSGFFSVGYGTPAYNEGYLYKVGLGFDILSVLPLREEAGRHGLTIGIEGEYATGSFNTIEDIRSDVRSEDGSLYGGAVTLRLLEIIYVGLGYGVIKSEESGPKGDFSLKGNYSNYIIGINIPIGLYD
jgi:hypothetical protein